MKKIFVLLLISFTSYAQTQKGSFSFGTGGVTYNHEKASEAERGDNISVNPSVGYLFSDNFEAGLGVLYNFNRYREVTLISKSHDIALTPYVKYNFGKQRFQPFVGLSGGLIKGHQKHDGAINNTYRGFVTDATLGGNYFFTRSIALGLNASYRYIKQKEDTKVFGDLNRITTKLYLGFSFTFYLSSVKE